MPDDPEPEQVAPSPEEDPDRLSAKRHPVESGCLSLFRIVALLFLLMLGLMMVGALVHVVRERPGREAILLGAAVSAVCLVLFMLVERWATASRGSRVPFPLRWWIPLPVLLGLTVWNFAESVGYGYKADVAMFYGWTPLAAAALLPSLLSNKKPVPFDLSIRIWIAQAIILLAIDLFVRNWSEWMASVLR